MKVKIKIQKQFDRDNFNDYQTDFYVEFEYKD